jgi:pimeloyl-ACP methyl ester carboxylesterase
VAADLNVALKMAPATQAVSDAYLPTSLSAMLGEQEMMPTSLAQAGALRQLGDRPLVVLTSGAEMGADQRRAAGLSAAQVAADQQARKQLQDEQASWSTHSRHILVPDATHYVQFDRPDVVIAAVGQVVAAVRR